MSVYEFAVGVTSHESLQQGVLVEYYSCVRVEAPSHLEASEIAILMAWSRPDAYVTECLDRI